MESWEFKVVHSWPGFETGTMAGLITLFRRHSGFMTNFKIFEAESRLGYGCGSCSVRRAQPGPGVLQGHGALLNTLYSVLVGPWQYQSGTAG